MNGHPTCLACKTSFATEEALEQHATAKLHWCCGPCGLVFVSQARLTKHKKKALHVANEADATKAADAAGTAARLDCDLCKRTFKSAGALEQHDADSKKRHEAIKKRGGLACNLCNRVFKSAAAREQHNLDSKEKHDAMRKEPETRECGVCKRTFSSEFALRQHEADPGKKHVDIERKGGSECGVCKKTFKSAAALKQHEADSSKQHSAKAGLSKQLEEIREKREFGCVLCKRGFKSAAALKQHEADSIKQHEAIRRREAQQQQRQQPQRQQQQQQQQEQAPLTQSEAQRSQRQEQNVQQQQQQQAGVSEQPLQQLQPKKKKKKAKEFECEECGKRFVRDEDLSRHAQSLAHHPLSDLPCIAGLYEEAVSASGAGCTARFTSPSAMLLHLESGSCSSGINMETLNAIIGQKDTDCVIRERWTASDDDDDDDDDEEEEDIAPALGKLRLGSRPATPDRSESADSGGAILTPGSEVSVPSPLFSIPSVPTPRCPLCPGKRRKFPSMMALGQHMQSAAHTATEKIYHCPVSLLAGAVPPGAVRRLTRRLRRERGRGFSTASGLAQHLESGACVGGEIALRVAMCYVEERLRQGDLPVSMLA
ncbi:putative zinc finger protein 840 [Escovopsis weberi]|uniref:Putative zinc finger protein 840 n=1 Tax=Escovopsis weberi TaxID=150374 RepID=A0A0M8MRQ9_ESCWE|nr:putative zinc finger protein 840 [Escovopsis weberi]